MRIIAKLSAVAIHWGCPCGCPAVSRGLCSGKVGRVGTKVGANVETGGRNAVRRVVKVVRKIVSSIRPKQNHVVVAVAVVGSIMCGAVCGVRKEGEAEERV